MGKLSEEQLQHHPQGNLIMRGLGMRDPESSVIEAPLRTGDWIVLCSDGLTDELTDTEISRLWPPLILWTMRLKCWLPGRWPGGGRDNVSVVVVEYDGPDYRQPWVGNLQPDLLWSVGGGVASALAVAGLWWWFAHRQG